MLHFSRETLELHDIDVVQVVEMSDLHVEADIILLATQAVRANLFVRNAIQVKGTKHFGQDSLWLSCSCAVHVEGTSTDLHPCGG